MINSSTLNVCPICENKINNKIILFEEKMFRMEGRFEYVDCSNCQAISIVQPPINLSRYYPENNYYSVKKISFIRRNFMCLRDLAYTVSYPGANLFRRYFPNSALESTLIAANKNKQSRILDVGCGDGQLLKSLARIGMKNLTGVDPLLSTNQNSQGVNLISGDISIINGEFDLITFHHSLEHIQYPQSILKYAKKLLAPGGRVLIRIPTRDSLAYLIYRDNWFQIDAPRHMCLHSHNSIAYIAEQAGLAITSIQYDSMPMQFWASEIYQAGLPLGSPKQRIYRLRNQRFYRKLSEFANKNGVGDQLVVQLIAI